MIALRILIFLAILLKIFTAPDPNTLYFKENNITEYTRVVNENNHENEEISHIHFKSTVIDSSVSDMIWCGNNKEVILVLSEKGSVYRSEDRGLSWKILNEVLHKSGYLEIEEGEKVGEVEKLVPSPVDKELIILQGTHGINWKSRDCCRNVIAMNQGRKVTEFLFHPTERDWVLATAWSLCEDFEDQPCQIYKELFYSKDVGEEWELIEDYVVQFSWGRLNAAFTKVPKERIILAHEPQGKGHQKIMGWSKSVHISASDDFFNTSIIVMPYGNKFLLNEYYFFIAQVLDDKTQDVQLLVSSPNLNKYQFTMTEMPFKRFKEFSYTILDSSEGQVFLHVNHYGSNSRFGNIYISDSTGTRYSMSLPHNVRNSDGQCDFEKILSVEGIYLANVFDSKQVKKSEIESQSTKIPVKNSKQIDLNNYMQTLISFDKGGIWKSLSAPLIDSLNHKITCTDEDCTLHLHSVSNMKYGPFYSSENAVGLILGTGNVGHYLSQHADEINTFMSRDGGLTWQEVAKGSHIYEFGDHGSLLLMAPDQEATDTLLFSTNEGISFKELKFANNFKIEVENIIIEPDNVAKNFILYGQYENSDKGVLVGINFDKLHNRDCKGVENPADVNSDYELWTPHDSRYSKCLLGRKVSYVRKKQDANCFNGEKHEKRSFIENCICTEEDWECDLGFMRDKNGPCYAIKSNSVKLL